MLDVNNPADIVTSFTKTLLAIAAVDRVYELAGGSSIYEDNALQRCFRDVHVTTQHIMVAAPIFEVTGRVALGLPAGGPL